ncbi:unnamed protein product [Owenia fusiformis]|uniref:Uncharacterized protein n=1 Tax=Owenia fusiformis TaxID=6347 RepID=A0A8J1UE75_OWEFU|nr:unnamed protein product [Owenia fusiformis]
MIFKLSLILILLCITRESFENKRNAASKFTTRQMRLWIGQRWERKGYTWGITTLHGDPIEEVTRQIACDKLSLSIGVKRYIKWVTTSGLYEEWNVKCSPKARHINDCKKREYKWAGKYKPRVHHQSVKCNFSNSAAVDRSSPCRTHPNSQNMGQTVCDYHPKDPNPPVELCCHCWMFFEDPFSNEVMPLGSMSKAAKTACGFKENRTECICDP